MSQCVWYVSVGKTRFIDLSSLYTGQTGSDHSWMYVILCLSFFSWSSAKQTLMQPMNMGTHHCTMPASGAKTSWLRLALPLVVSHRRHLCPCFIFYFIMKPLSAVFRIWWLMGLLWAFVTNMGRLPWIKANLTCVNSSEVSHCALQLNKCISVSLFLWWFLLLLCRPEMAEKMGQNLTKIPFKDSFWKGTTRTRPRESHSYFLLLYFRLSSEIVHMNICPSYLFLFRQWHFEQTCWRGLQTTLSSEQN